MIFQKNLRYNLLHGSFLELNKKGAGIHHIDLKCTKFEKLYVRKPEESIKKIQIYESGNF